MSELNAQIRTSIDAFDVDSARNLLRDALKNPNAETYYLAALVAFDETQQLNYLELAVNSDPSFTQASILMAKVKNKLTTSLQPIDMQVGETIPPIPPPTLDDTVPVGNYLRPIPIVHVPTTPNNALTTSTIGSNTFSNSSQTHPPKTRQKTTLVVLGVGGLIIVAFIAFIVLRDQEATRQQAQQYAAQVRSATSQAGTQAAANQYYRAATSTAVYTQLNVAERFVWACFEAQTSTAQRYACPFLVQQIRAPLSGICNSLANATTNIRAVECDYIQNNLVSCQFVESMGGTYRVDMRLENNLVCEYAQYSN